MKRISFTFKLFFLLYFLPNMTFSQEISPTLSNYPGGYNISCHGGNNGSISIVVVGEAPFLYNWSNGSTSKNQTQLSAGNYTLIVTDANSNTASMDFDLTQPNSIDVILHPRVFEGGHNIPEQGGHDGLIETEISGGVSPYSYSWNNNTVEQNLEGVPAGSYTLTVTDMNGCTASASATLTEASDVHVTSISSPSQNGYNISCHGVKDGSIQLNVAGGTPPYDFTWMDGYKEKDRTELAPGNYTVIIKDANNIAEAAQILLTGPAELQSQLTPTIYSNTKNISCFGCANGHISTTVTGGVSPYTCLWNDGATNANRNGLVAGQYNVQITDANGCIVEAGVNIIGPEREDWTMMGNSGTDPVSNFFGTLDSTDFVFKSNNSERLRIKANGEINLNKMIGQDYDVLMVGPTGELLRVDPDGNKNNLQADPNPVQCLPWNTCGNANRSSSYLGTRDYQDLIIKTFSTERMRITKTGIVGIGIDPNLQSFPALHNYKLLVGGTLGAKEIWVSLGQPAWPDYVFSEDYKLTSLEDIKKFTEKNKHLPEMPSAEEIGNDGAINLGLIQTNSVKEIEQLYLQLFKLNDRITELEKQNIALQKMVTMTK